MTLTESNFYRGDFRLGDDRLAMLRRWEVDGKTLFKDIKSFERSLLAEIDSAPMIQDGSRIKWGSASRLRSVSSQGFRSLRSQTEASLRSAMRASIDRAVKSYVRHFKTIGVEIPTAQQLESLKRSAMKKLWSEEFPPDSGLTTKGRIAKATSRHRAFLEQNLKRTRRGDPKILLASDAKRAVSLVGKAGVRGGSFMNTARRLVVAEEMRAANEIAVLLMQDVGAELAYWRLSPAHPWYGGGEICEVHAADTQDGVGQTLRSLGVAPSSVDTEGLHHIDRWPHYPHPYCMCYPEPLFISGKIRS